MASQIRISPDQMRERANSYQTESGNVSEMIGRLDSLLQSLLGEWEGQSSEAYRERYESLRPAFTQAEELLAEISKALNTTAQNMENVDESIASGFRGQYEKAGLKAAADKTAFRISPFVGNAQLKKLKQ